MEARKSTMATTFRQLVILTMNLAQSPTTVLSESLLRGIALIVRSERFEPCVCVVCVLVHSLA